MEHTRPCRKNHRLETSRAQKRLAAHRSLCNLYALGKRAEARTESQIKEPTPTEELRRTIEHVPQAQLTITLAGNRVAHGLHAPRACALCGPVDLVLCVPPKNADMCLNNIFDKPRQSNLDSAVRRRAAATAAYISTRPLSCISRSACYYLY